MIALAVTWMATAGNETAVATLFHRLSDASRQEPGCLLFQVHRHPDDARRFFVYEQFEDEAALDAHRATAHFATIARGELPALAQRIEGQIYHPLA